WEPNRFLRLRSPQEPSLAQRKCPAGRRFAPFLLRRQTRTSMSKSRRQVMKQGKGLVRAANRRGTASGKAARCERQDGRPAEPTMCQTCGALFSRRVWRRQRKVAEVPVRPVVSAECPACKEMRRGEYWGRVVVRGEYAASNEAEIRRRIRN